MTAQDQIDKLKKLPPLTQQVCATCAFLKTSPNGPEFNRCTAMSDYTGWSWDNRCRGRYWAPRQPLFTRLKRWLIG